MKEVSYALKGLFNWEYSKKKCNIVKNYYNFK